MPVGRPLVTRPVIPPRVRVSTSPCNWVSTISSEKTLVPHQRLLVRPNLIFFFFFSLV